MSKDNQANQSVNLTSRDNSDGASFYKKLSPNEPVIDQQTYELLKGATELARKAGHHGTCMTPFVYEYLQKKSRSELDG